MARQRGKRRPDQSGPRPGGQLGEGGRAGGRDQAAPAQAIYNNWAGIGNKRTRLSATELDAVLNSLTPDQLKQLNGVLGKSSSWPWEGPDKNLQGKFATLFLGSNASPQTIHKLAEYLTNLPQLKTAGR